MVDRILALIKQKGLSVSAVEKQLGFGNGAIKRFSTNSPSIDKIIAISNFLNTSVEFILFGKETAQAFSEDVNKLITYYNSLNDMEKGIILGKAETLYELAAERAAEQKKEQRTEPIHATNKCLTLNDACKIRYYDRAASAGTGLFLDEAIAETLTVQNTPEAQQADYAIPVSGDSMEEEYHDGDIVLVKSCPCVRKGEVGIFLLDGSVYIKEYGGKFLISYNEDYPPIDLSKYETAACLGKVIGVADVNY